VLLDDPLVDVSVPLDDVSVLLDDVSVPLVSDPGTSAPEGAVEVADDSADSLAVLDVEVDAGVEAAVLGAVDGTGDCSAVVASAVLGSAGSTLVTGGATAVDGDSTVAWVFGAGAWVAGACCVAGACGICGATAVGTSTGACGATTSGSGAVTSGAGATTVVVAPESPPGWANAGAIPPVSAVKEMTTPDANTATTPRFEQSSSGLSTLIDSFGCSCGPPSVAKHAFARRMPGNRNGRPLWSQRIHRWFGLGVT